MVRISLDTGSGTSMMVSCAETTFMENKIGSPMPGNGVLPVSASAGSSGAARLSKDTSSVDHACTEFFG